MIQKNNSTVTVDRRLIKENCNFLRTFLDPDTEITAVIKSDGYGHGAVEVAKTLEEKVSSFAVNAIQEGVELRENDITKPILIFEVPQKSEALKYRSYDLTATFSAKEHFEWVPEGISYHLNFDTGMGRLGLRPEEAKEIAQMVQNYSHLTCKGIYSHFATANILGSHFVEEQLQRFKELRTYFPDDLTTHISNTGGAIYYDIEQFDRVRFGISLYGYPPGEKLVDGLKPALNWHTHIVQMNPIKAGQSVSYGAEWQAPEDGFVAVLPVGYEDGLKKREAESRLNVRINQKEYPIVGAVTMNYTMIFLGQDDYALGTRVDLLYRGSDAYRWTENLDTIPYEVLTSIDKRIPREYI